MSLPVPFLEAINGILLTLFIWVILWFGYDVFSVRRETGSWSATYREAAASIACAIAFTGDLIIRASVWIYRHIENDGPVPKDLMQMTTLTITIGVAVMIVGCACIIRHLSPPGLGRAPWAIAVLTALLFGIGMAL